MKQLLWYVFAGTRGGVTRARIAAALTTPQNAHQLAKTLSLDYKTIRHHLKFLEKNNMITVINKEGYGAMYFHSTFFTAHKDVFGEICQKIGKDLGKP